MSTNAAVITVLLVVINAAFAVTLDRAPSGYRIGEPEPGRLLFPIVEPPAGWRRYIRPAALYGTILTGVAISIAPMLIS